MDSIDAIANGLIIAFAFMFFKKLSEKNNKK